MRTYDPEDFKDSIANGEAYDSRRHPEITREEWEKRIGGMRDVFGDIDDVIDRYVENGKKQGVVFYGDLRNTIVSWQSINLVKYIKFSLDNLREEMEELVEDKKGGKNNEKEPNVTPTVKKSSSDVKSYISTK